jgi:cob(I)alamin adenosyltransferase
MIQVYTGDGKGKTTAALGLALRAAGAGHNVFIAQFMKGRSCAELTSLKKIKSIKIEQFGNTCFIKKFPTLKDKALAKKGLKIVKDNLAKEKYSVVILDEICVALNLGLVNLREVTAIIDCAPEEAEVVLTGRGAPKEIIERADLVSEIKEIKHYFKKGVQARRGIEY